LKKPKGGEQFMSKKAQSERLQKEAEVADQTLEGEAAVQATQHANETTDEVDELEFNIDELQQELTEARATAEGNWEKLLRAQAELENQRKRSKRDIENAHKYAIERFATELLSVKDSLELGLGHSTDQTSAEKLHEGMDLTLKMLVKVMEKFNIEEVDPQGEPFNPELHQAMTVQQSTELEPNTVATVMQKGYTLNGRLLRPAMVIVSKRS
jgi:molecular chaperone GrpE